MYYESSLLPLTPESRQTIPLVFDDVQITRVQGGDGNVWATSYSIQGNEVTGVTNGRDFRFWLSGTNQLSNASQWQCDLSQPSPTTSRRIARAVTLATFLGTLAGSLVGLVAEVPLLGASAGLIAALISALSTSTALSEPNQRLATTGGFVAEEEEGPGMVVNPTNPHEPHVPVTPTLRVAGRR